jgi:hypothetical protein
LSTELDRRLSGEPPVEVGGFNEDAELELMDDVEVELSLGELVDVPDDDDDDEEEEEEEYEREAESFPGDSSRCSVSSCPASTTPSAQARAGSRYGSASTLGLWRLVIARLG